MQSIDSQTPGMNEIIAAAKGMKGRGLLYSLMKKDWNQKVSLAAKEAGLKPVESYVFLDFLWQEKTKRRDPDNVAAGKKFVIDGLVQAGILAGDGWSQISGFADHWRTVTEDDRVHVGGVGPGVLVEIRGLCRGSDELDLVQGAPC